MTKSLHTVLATLSAPALLIGPSVPSTRAAEGDRDALRSFKTACTSTFALSAATPRRISTSKSARRASIRRIGTSTLASGARRSASSRHTWDLISTAGGRIREENRSRVR